MPHVLLSPNQAPRPHPSFNLVFDLKEQHVVGRVLGSMGEPGQLA